MHGLPGPQLITHGKYPLCTQLCVHLGCIREGSFLKTQIRNPQDIRDVSSERAEGGCRCESATACTAHPPSPDARPDEEMFDWLGRHWLFGLVA